MTGTAPASASVSPCSQDWPRPQDPSSDSLTDPGAQFAVEWQVVEGIHPYPVAQAPEAWHLS